MVRPFVFAILATLPLMGAAAADSRDCISDKAARQMIQDQKVLPLPEAIRRAGNIDASKIVGVNLCRSNGEAVYEVEMVEAGRNMRQQIPSAP